MNMSLLLILTLMLSLCSDSVMSVLCSHDNERVIIVKETGNSSRNCCVYGECYCSNLALALEHVQSNTEIRIMSNVSLHGFPQFESPNDSNITIIGYNNPTVKCDHQGGFVGINVGCIIIQNIVWDSCDQEIEINGFINAHVTECSFQNTLPPATTLVLKGSGLVYINNSMFSNINNIGVYLIFDNKNNSSKIPSITIYNSNFNNAPLTVAINDYQTGFHNGILNVTIINSNFTNNVLNSMQCKGTDYLTPRISIIASSFVNNSISAVNAKNCDIILQNNCSFVDNRWQSPIEISYGTISMIGPVLFYNNYVLAEYGGAIYLFNSNMSVNKGPIKFHNNTAAIGGAIYMCNNSNIFANITDLEFYNNTATSYGGAFYIEASLCENSKGSIPFYYNMLADVPYATSNSAGFSGNFVFFFAYDASDCTVPNMPYKIGNLFATQPCNVLSMREAAVHGNFIYGPNTFSFWLHDLHFNLIVTDCFNNLYGLVQVDVECIHFDFSGSYEYTIDSAHNNVTMIYNNLLECNIDKSYRFQLKATVLLKDVYNSIPHYIPITTQIDVQISPSNNHEENCEKDIAHFFIHVDFNTKCVSLSCQYFAHLPDGIHCSVGYGYFSVTPGYWFSNGFTEFVDNCPQGHCDNTFDLYDSIYTANVSVNVSYPNSNDQCVTHWTGLACGECDKEYLIIHDSTSCVPSDKCLLHNLHVLQLVLFFLISLLYWIAVISLIFVLLHFRFNITAGYAYGIIFYYSVLEQTVNASYIGTQNNSNNPFITMCLTILSSIGNMKPPFQILKFCFGKFLVMDHMFLTYIHPVIVTILIIFIFISARNSVIVARAVGRYINSKSISILLMLSYSSITYTSMQLFRPLTVYHTNPLSYKYPVWHVYLSATVKYFHGRHIAYCIIAILCEVIIGIGFPFILLFQPYLTKYFNINFISIMPVLDQLKGCYKQEYRWFTAYYLLCRQVIYAVDIGTDFIPNYKYGLMVMVYVLIMMFHVWLQPYNQKRLNILDSTILMTLMLVYIGEHTSYGSTIVLWIVPLFLFINCITLSSRLKYLLIPVSSLGLCILTLFLMLRILLDGNLLFVKASSDYSFYYINYTIALISFIMLSAYLIYVSKHLCILVIKKSHKHEYRLINVQNEDSYEDSGSNEDT